VLQAINERADNSVANVDVANWGTFGGALCFAIGGVLQGFDRPARVGQA